MRISIITINFNNLEGLKKTMSSVLNQTYSNVEYIIIDGGSTDGSKEYIEKYQNHLNYWVSEPDKGIYNAMNKGIQRATGDYLLFLNSGDWLVRKDVLGDISTLLYSKMGIYYGDLYIAKNNDIIERCYPDQLNFYYFFDKGHLPHPAMFIKNELFGRLNTYNENYKIIGDWDFYVSAICKYNVSYSHIKVFVTYHDGSGISNLPESRPLVLEERKRSLQKHFPLFIDNFEQFFKAQQKLNSKRYVKFLALEAKQFSRKINTIYLAILSKIFKIKV